MESYSQWVRSAIASAQGRNGQTISLFDSSVPEPTDLLRKTVISSMTPQLGPEFVSAFRKGNPFLIEILSARYGVPQDQILSTTGATSGLSLLFRTLAAPGDHVLVETPGFDLFIDLAKHRGIEVELFERIGDDYRINIDALIEKIRPGTRLVVLSNLHNPSGMALEQGSLRQLATIAEKRGFLVIVDEVYADYADREAIPKSAAELSPAFVSVSSLSKFFNLSTLRCGWIVGAHDVIARVRDTNDRLEFGVSNLTHAIAARILANPSRFEQYSRQSVAKCRPLLDRWFAEMKREELVAGRLPQAGCICFPELPGIKNTTKFSAWLVERYGVLVAPGEYFGRAGHVRIGFAQREDDLETGLSRLAEGLRTYRGRQNAPVSVRTVRN